MKHKKNGNSAVGSGRDEQDKEGGIVINVILDPIKIWKLGKAFLQYPTAGDIFIFEAYMDKVQVSIGSPRTADRGRETGRASLSASNYLDYFVFWGRSVSALLAL